MQTVINDKGVLTKEVIVTIPKEELKKQYDKTLADVSKSIKMPGYREGKIPARVVELKYKNQVLEQLRDQLLRDSLRHASEKVKSLGDWDLNDPEITSLNQDFVCTFTTSVLPEISLPDFKELKYKKEDTNVSAEEINNIIKNIINRNSDPVAVTDGSAALEADMVKFSYDIKVNGASIVNRETLAPANLLIIDGVDFGDENKKVLIGKKTGDSLEVAGKLRENFSEKEYSGKDSKISIKVIEISRIAEQELTDELAKKLNFESATKLKDFVTEDCKRRKEAQSSEKIRLDLLDALATKVNFDIPEKLLQDTIHAEQHKDHHHHDHNDDHVHDENCNHDHDHDHDHGHVHDENCQHDHDHDDHAHNHAPVNEEEIKTQLKKRIILEMVYRNGKITVTQEDLMNYVGQMARSYGMNPQDLVKQIDDKMAMQIEHEIKLKKGLDLIYKSAVSE